MHSHLNYSTHRMQQQHSICILPHRGERLMNAEESLHLYTLPVMDTQSTCTELSLTTQSALSFSELCMKVQAITMTNCDSLHFHTQHHKTNKNLWI